MGEARAYLEREQRAEVDDLPSAARDHVLACGLREQPDGFEVDVNHLVPVFFRELFTLVSPLNPGAIDEYVDLPAHLRDSFRKNFFDLLHVA